jgi:hypothetical protein
MPGKGPLGGYLAAWQTHFAMSEYPERFPASDKAPHPYQYLFEGQTLADLTSLQLELLCPPLVPDTRVLAAVQPETLQLDYGVFTSTVPVAGAATFPTVVVAQLMRGLLVSCACAAPKVGLCEHQALVLISVLRRKELRVFFDAALRRELLAVTARDYGLENAPDLDAHFAVVYAQSAVSIVPKEAGLYALTPASKQELVRQLLPARRAAPAALESQRLVVFGKHKYYGHLTIQLAEAVTTTAGKLKNPVSVLNPLDGLWQLTDAEELKFYTGLARFQHNYDDSRTAAAINALRAIVKNAPGLPAYAHNPTVSDKLTAPALLPLTLRHAPTDLRLSVAEKGEFYEVSGCLLLHDEPHDLRLLTIRYDYFVATTEALYLVEDLAAWRVIEFFKKRNNTLLIHRSRFAEFQRDVLANLEDKLHIAYAYLRPATPAQRAGSGLDQATILRLYLTDAGPHVELLPVVSYGPHEVGILSRRQLYATDELGRPFVLDRDKELEDRYLAALLRHYPAFQEQLHEPTLYVPKTQFLQEEWFLAAFEDWQGHKIEILGFNKLRNNSLNPNRARIAVRVSSRETNWFDTRVSIKFGPQKVTMRQLQQAIRHRSRYVRLDDGTKGILPQEWVEKFARYFAAGTVVDEHIRTPKISFAAIAELYAPVELSVKTQSQLAAYQAATANFAGITPVPVPAALHATLRHYQQQGLNWLGFLDTFNFGGCLADDMGLGKTVQVLAFLLHQKAAGHAAANLVVVPTSLIFNWQAEVAKFAPALRVLTLHGAGRRATTAEFAAHDLVLTTYGTLVSDLARFVAYRFNYVFLDESQAIKNPDSQRYKAACLLQSRNRVVLTGTPVENNTFDLYGQLSFACPGLLGSEQHFREYYATPIDKFKDRRRAHELHRRVRPFILRRTKSQVASELPAKTEMVLYCEMGPQQRQVYDACRQEFRAMLMGQHPETPRKSSMHILQGLTRLRQICNAPALLRDEAFYGSDSAKLTALLEEIQAKAPQHKILVFSQFVGMLELIKQALNKVNIPFAYLTGQTRNRAAAVASFQENEEVRVFLISLKAGGTGLNLTAADYVYLVDPWWNPAVENQAIDRSHRLGQSQKVVAVRLICPDTIEEKIRQLQETKRELAHDLVKTDAAVLKTLTRQELLDLVA